MLFRRTSTLYVYALSVAGGCAIATTFATRIADACSPPPCSPARLAPPESSAVPLNAPALPYLRPSGGGSTATAFHLMSPGFSEISTTPAPDPWWPNGELLTASSPLTADDGYSIAYAETCTFAGGSPNGKRTFDVGPAQPLPTQSGLLKGANWKVGSRTVPTSSGSCVSQIEAMSLDLVLDASPELLAYAPVTGFKVKADGQSMRTIYYGAAKVDGNKIVITNLHAACGTREQWDDNGLTLGLHEIEVSAHVAGATNDPPAVKTKLNISCTDSNFEIGDELDPPDDVRDKDAGVAGTNDAGSPKTGDAGPGASAAAAGSDPTTTAGCACDLAGRSLPGGLSGLGAVVLALVGMVRRRTPSARRTRE